MKKFVIIDGNNICFRSFYALPMLSNFEGVISNAVFGFANTLVKIIEQEKPDYIAVAFDKGKKTFRHQMYKEYKAQRRPTPKELLDQLPLLRQMLDTMHIRYIELDDIEADDIIGVLSRKFDTENLIVSADKDVLQLINGNTSVYAPQKQSDAIVYNEKSLKEIMQIEPYQIIELKALMGDSSDNIPGVRGVGEKTALGLITEYGNLDGVYEHIDEVKGKTQEKLLADRESAYFSKKLATIVTDYNIDVKLDDFTYDFPFGDETLDFFKKYQFNSLLKKQELFGGEAKQESVAEEEEIVVVTEPKVAKEELATISRESTIFMYLNDEMFSIYDGDKECNFSIVPSLIDDYVHIEDILTSISDILAQSKIEMYDAKDMLTRLDQYGVDVANISFDCTIAKYLTNSNAKPMSFTQAVEYFALPKSSYAKNISTMSTLLKGKMKELDVEDLFYNIELPLVRVLREMERNGIKVDVHELNELETKYKNLLDGLTNEIYEMAGTNFNINSTKQLGEVLFDVLGLKSKSNKKDSTNVSVLNELVGQHPIVQKILEYRQYFKLYSTYIKAYLGCKDAHDFVHTTFNQTLTATGRLSSNDPNLQNIPSRSNEGKMLRKIFIPSTPNGSLVSADYSQIELRLLANFSGDDRLIDAYNQGEDIHSITASEIFGIPLSMVTDNMRRSAKAINFGIIYGMSDWGLSQNIGITKTEAKKYIARYFEKYPTIENYINGNVAFAKEHGYIRTIKNRIRFIPELKGNKMQQLFGERVAMNMPLQGSASDIIKLAMVKVYDVFKAKALKSKLILQIHDELVVDTVEGEEDIVKSILKDCMENVVDLKVKLSVNVSAGANLSEAK